MGNEDVMNALRVLYKQIDSLGKEAEKLHEEHERDLRALYEIGMRTERMEKELLRLIGGASK